MWTDYLVVQFSSDCCHFLSHMSKCFPRAFYPKYRHQTLVRLNKVLYNHRRWNRNCSLVFRSWGC